MSSLNSSVPLSIKARKDRLKSFKGLLVRKSNPENIPEDLNCRLCSFKTKDKSIFKDHIDTHTRLKLYKCRFVDCDYATSHGTHLTRHMRDHTKDRPHECQLCHTKFFFKFSLDRHMTTHPEPEAEIVQCQLSDDSTADKSDLVEQTKGHEEEIFFNCQYPGCTFSAKTLINLKRHEVIHPKEKFSCSICDYQATSKSQLVTHMRTHKKVKSPSTLSPTTTTKNPGPKNRMKKHNGLKPHQCEVPNCGYSTTHKSNLTDHMKTHTGEKPHECQLCHKKFTQKSNLERHTRTHTKDKPFKCDLCDYSCTQKIHLVVHLRRHSGEQPFKSQYPGCDFSTTTNGNLKHHEVVHTKEKNFSCSICDHKFGMKSSLKDHMKIHEKVKPFSCTLCSYRARQQSDIKKHMAQVHSQERNFKCHLCPYAGKTNGTLRDHLKSHSTRKLFACDECSYKTKYSSLVKRHQRMVHLGEHSGKNRNLKVRPGKLRKGLRSRVKTFKCKLADCDFVTREEKELASHLTSHKLPTLRLTRLK